MVGEFLKPVLTLDIVPGVRIGPFQLGMPIREAFNVIQKGSRAIRRAQVKYCKEEPLSADIIIDLFQDGFLLRFEPVTQRLRSIEIYDAQKLRLAYSNAIFAAPNLAPTFVRVYNHFGPSYPGHFDSELSVYFLHYPGLEFQFAIPPSYAHLYESAATAGSPDLPVEFPDGTTPMAHRVCLYKHEISGEEQGRSSSSSSGPRRRYSERAPSPPPLPAALLAAAREMDASMAPPPLNGDSSSSRPLTSAAAVDSAVSAAAAQATVAAAARLSDNLYFEEVLVRLGQGLQFAARGQGGAQLTFDSTVQDVLITLGPPNRIFDKAVDKMKIHAAASFAGRRSDQSPAPASSLGVMTAAAAAAVSSGAVARSPASSAGGSGAVAAQAAAAAASAAAASADLSVCPDYFYNYFDLGLDVLLDGDSHLVKKFVLHTNFPGVNFPRHAKCNFRIDMSQDATVDQSLLQNSASKHSSASIGPDTKWPVVAEMLGDCGQPVVHNRGWSMNPFGSILFYGYSNIIFEVIPSNQHISSVTIFR